MGKDGQAPCCDWFKNISTTPSPLCARPCGKDALHGSVWKLRS